ncbi:hypothetical protein [Hymenobacter mucosus]|uniref:Fibronectin type-III domain-containing protein n=1 Tax=Hymenobacter mucosus TaxID=1411120 RepID=A0A239AA52_9BACT|nr:hypothetical protein [Hymenobacter mucosus]SNR92399.1 hypothetical protein SAMN06269173_11196 [Hymenobacter mucosus]
MAKFTKPTVPDKTSGQTLSAAEFNQVKTFLGLIADVIDGSQTVEGISLPAMLLSAVLDTNGKIKDGVLAANLVRLVNGALPEGVLPSTVIKKDPVTGKAPESILPERDIQGYDLNAAGDLVVNVDSLFALLKAKLDATYAPIGSGNTTTPTPPTALDITATPGDGQVTISKTGGEGTGVTYALYRGTSASGTLIATALPFTDTGRPNGTAVTYYATATNAGGTVSDTDTATPKAPATTTPTPTAGVVNDTFTRADSTTSLGTAETGQSWVVDALGVLGIRSGTAYLVSGNGYAFLPAPSSSMRVRGKLTYGATLVSQGIIFNALNKQNRFVMVTEANTGKIQLLRIENDGATQLAITSTALVAPNSTPEFRVDTKKRADGTGRDILCFLNDVQLPELTWYINPTEAAKYDNWNMAGYRCGAVAAGAGLDRIDIDALV